MEPPNKNEVCHGQTVLPGPPASMAPQVNWLSRLVGGTRQQVIEILLRSDQTVQELAAEVGVSANAIRGHLAAMERDGLVRLRETRRDTGGKPANVYTVTRDADELLPKAYVFVLRGLLSALEEREDAATVRDLLVEVGDRAAVPSGGTREERVRAAGDALRSLGGTVEIVQEDGRWRLQGFSCPLSSLAAHDRRVCGLAEALVRGTTGGSVKEVCQRDTRPRCAFEISFPEVPDCSGTTSDALPPAPPSGEDRRPPSA